MTDQSFELDLLRFHGDPLDLEFEVPGASADWLLEGLSAGDDGEVPLQVDDDIAFRAHLRAQLVGSTVHLQGSIDGGFFYRCGRCLQWRQMELDEDVDFVMMSRPSWDDAYGGRDEIVLEEQDMNVSYYEGEIIDLRPLLREAVLLTLPTFPVCPDSLSEACDTAYEAIVGDEVLEENEAQSMDLRWAKLREIELDDKES